MQLRSAEVKASYYYKARFTIIYSDKVYQWDMQDLRLMFLTDQDEEHIIIVYFLLFVCFSFY